MQEKDGGISMEAYQDFAKVYDELMDATPYEEWSERIGNLIEKYGVSKPERDAEELLDSERNLVVDLGCGTGTLTQLLYQKGYDRRGQFGIHAEYCNGEKGKKRGRDSLSVTGYERTRTLQYGRDGCECLRFRELYIGRG